MAEPQKLGQILASTTKMNQVVSKYEREDCPVCGIKRKQIVSIYKTCDVCHRKEFFAKLPLEQQEAFISEIVRPRYTAALPEQISEGLWKQLIGAADKGVYLWGKTGVGKTYALAALGRTFIYDGFVVKKISFEKLCLIIRDTFRPDSGRSTWEGIEPYIECDKLILEDVSVAISPGKQESDFSLRTLLVILDERSEEWKATFITGNKPPSELTKAFDERITSRLKQGEIIRVTGEDRRA